MLRRLVCIVSSSLHWFANGFSSVWIYDLDLLRCLFAVIVVHRLSKSKHQQSHPQTWITLVGVIKLSAKKQQHRKSLILPEKINGTPNRKGKRRVTRMVVVVVLVFAICWLPIQVNIYYPNLKMLAVLSKKKKRLFYDCIPCHDLKNKPQSFVVFFFSCLLLELLYLLWDFLHFFHTDWKKNRKKSCCGFWKKTNLRRRIGMTFKYWTSYQNIYIRLEHCNRHSAL